MPDARTLAWPFFDDVHRALAGGLRPWAERALADVSGADVDAACRTIVRRLGEGGWLRHTVPAAHGGVHERLDLRALCLARETLAHVSGLADFAFAMQGLGAGPVSLFGSEALQARYLPRVAAGEAIAAFAISEAAAGSDVSAMRTTARRDGPHFVIDGEKTWVSNGGIADLYVVFCRLEGSDEERAYVALVVEPDDPGFAVAERIQTIAPHPLATIRLDGCRVPADRVVGEVGRGLRVALGTLDLFRTTVGAAALGFARRALDEALAHVTTRTLFGQALKDFQLTQARLADMATEVDASALLVYRAAWTRDHGARRITREAAMAKLYATEAAQRVIDAAVQLFGGRGVVHGNPVERLYREIRALRIYEGTSEVQRLVIASQLLESYETGRATTQPTPTSVPAAPATRPTAEAHDA
ncbi:MAG TPA: acyl-CoA dehydrogenase family protein [Gemmatimonadaceae bacterium]|nr:acyl-CoA dehydrogenase family protein [Gemmatimonadaceae bacterium]